jgi:alanyl-tRNA synthetase
MGFERVWQCKTLLQTMIRMCLHHLSKSGGNYRIEIQLSVILNDSEESEEQNKTNIAIRVIVDHVRAVAFAIADGQLPPIQEQDM